MNKTMTITAKSALILSAAAIGAEKDRELAAGEEATVPHAYGLHLVNDKFADKVTSNTGPRRRPTKAEIKAAAANIAAFGKAVEAVEVAEAKVAAAGDDPDAKAAAEKELAAAEAALDRLQA